MIRYITVLQSLIQLVYVHIKEFLRYKSKNIIDLKNF